MKSVTQIFSLLLVFFLSSAFTSVMNLDDAAARWVNLGSKKVNYGLDRDVIQVGVRDGSFRKLKVKVSGGALNMHKMTVHYLNGSTEQVALRHNFGRRGGSRVIDLNGGKRIIQKVVFWYDTKNLARKRAKVTLFGRR